MGRIAKKDSEGTSETTFEEGVPMKTEAEMKTEGNGTMDTINQLRGLFETRPKDVFSPPVSPEEKAVENLNNCRKAIVEGMGAVTGFAAISSPERHKEMLDAIDFPELKKVIQLMWFNRYMYEQTLYHQMSTAIRQTVEHQLKAAGILKEDAAIETHWPLDLDSTLKMLTGFLERR